MLKTWIKGSAEEREKHEDPFCIFEKILSPSVQSSQLRYLELQTIILQSKQFVEQLRSAEEQEEATQILGELYSEEISQNAKQAQQAVPVPDCLAQAFMIPRSEIE